MGQAVTDQPPPEGLQQGSADCSDDGARHRGAPEWPGGVSRRKAMRYPAALTSTTAARTAARPSGPVSPSCSTPLTATPAATVERITAAPRTPRSPSPTTSRLGRERCSALGMRHTAAEENCREFVMPRAPQMIPTSDRDGERVADGDGMEVLPQRVADDRELVQGAVDDVAAQLGLAEQRGGHGDDEQQDGEDGEETVEGDEGCEPGRPVVDGPPDDGHDDAERLVGLLEVVEGLRGPGEGSVRSGHGRVSWLTRANRARSKANLDIAPGTGEVAGWPRASVPARRLPAGPSRRGP